MTWRLNSAHVLQRLNEHWLSALQHDSMTQCWLNGGTQSTTPAQHWPRIGLLLGSLGLLAASSQTLAGFMRPASRHFSKKQCFQMQKSACLGDVTGCNDAHETLNIRYFNVGPRTSTTWTNINTPFCLHNSACLRIRIRIRIFIE